MFSFLILSFVLCANAQSSYQQQQQQQQSSSNNNNILRPLYPENYPSTNQYQTQNPPRVRGSLLSDDLSTLPIGSQIIVSLTDVAQQDVASRPLNTLVLYGSYRFPIPFEIPYSMAQVQAASNTFRQYAIQARIEKDGQLLYISDQYTPVQLIPAPINAINVFMKKISTSNFPGSGGTFTTRPSININRYICLQAPEVGPCKAYVERYFYNAQLGSCQIFQWGGCGGNENRFDARHECESSCSFFRQKMINNNVRQ